MKNQYICFVAGKSGGHLLPCITKAKNIIENSPHTKILFFTTNTHLDKELIKKSSFIKEHVTLPLTSLTPNKFFSHIRFMQTFLTSFFLSLKLLFEKKPIKIISMGGALSLPVCFAGYLLGIPFELIELNVVPGKTVTTLAPLAHSIATCFTETQKYFSQKCYKTEYPLRFNKKDHISSIRAREQLGLDPHKKTIFILGGSQGSVFINNSIKSWLETTTYTKESLQIIHQIGHTDRTDWKDFYHQLGINAYIFDFYHHLQYCYSAADLIICRSGAGTLFEIAYFNKPCITIPLETSSTMHQVDNATAFKKIRGDSCSVLHQKDFSNDMLKFEQSITNLLNTRKED